MTSTQKAIHDQAHQVQANAAEKMPGMPLNCFPEFWPVYHGAAGSDRRRKLLALFQRTNARLPVNQKAQATLKDSDLAVLLKRGLLSSIRKNAPTSRCRQTYLVLAS